MNNNSYFTTNGAKTQVLTTIQISELRQVALAYQGLDSELDAGSVYWPLHEAVVADPGQFDVIRDWVTSNVGPEYREATVNQIAGLISEALGQAGDPTPDSGPDGAANIGSTIDEETDAEARVRLAKSAGLGDPLRYSHAVAIHQLGGDQDVMHVASKHGCWYIYITLPPVPGTSAGGGSVWRERQNWPDVGMRRAALNEQKRHNREENRAYAERLRNAKEEKAFVAEIEADKANLATKIQLHYEKDISAELDDIIAQVKRPHLIGNGDVTASLKHIEGWVRMYSEVEDWLEMDPSRQPGDVDSPFWIGGRKPDDPDPRFVILLRNCMLNITNPLVPVELKHDHRYFGTNLLPFAYDRAAKPPRRLLRVVEHHFGCSTRDKLGNPLVDRDGVPLTLVNLKHADGTDAKYRDGKPIEIPQLDKVGGKYVIPVDSDGYPMVILGDDGEPLPEDKEAKRAIFVFMALCLIPGNKYRKFGLWQGVPQCGKGILHHVLAALLGGRYGVIEKDIRKLDNDHITQNIPGKLLLTISDPHLDDKYESSALRGLIMTSTGGDDQDINPKNRAPYTSRFLAKILLICNRIPHLLKDPTGALEERVYPVYFPRHVPPEDRIPGLEDTIIENELPGLLNLLLEYLNEILTKPASEVFRIPQSAMRIVEDLRHHSNQAIPFALECLKLPDPEQTVDRSLMIIGTDLHLVYMAWTKRNCERNPMKLSVFNAEFASALDTLKIKYVKTRPHESRESARGKLYRGRGPETWFGFAALHNWALAGKKWEVDANHDKNYREDNELTTEQIMGQLRMADDNILRLTELLCTVCDASTSGDKDLTLEAVESQLADEIKRLEKLRKQLQDRAAEQSKAQ